MPKLINYDLENRTAKFAESIIDLVKNIKINPINKRIIPQIVASSGSVGANYCEANEAESKKDFVHKMAIAKKEIKETKHWLRLLVRAENNQGEHIKPIWKEAQELLPIFSKIIYSCQHKNEH